MPKGPFGQIEIRGPLSDKSCRMVVYVGGIGRPRDKKIESETLLELEESIRKSNEVNTPRSGKYIFSNVPHRMNLIEIAVGLRDDMFQPETIENSYNSIIKKMEKIDSVARIEISYITCGEPKEVLESKASATRF